MLMYQPKRARRIIFEVAFDDTLQKLQRQARNGTEDRPCVGRGSKFERAEDSVFGLSQDDRCLGGSMTTEHCRKD